MPRPKGDRPGKTEAPEAPETTQEPAAEAVGGGEPETEQATPREQHEAASAEATQEAVNQLDLRLKAAAEKAEEAAEQAAAVKALEAKKVEVVYEARVPNLTMWVEVGTPGFPNPMNPQQPFGEVKPVKAKFKKRVIMKVQADGNRKPVEVGEYATSDEKIIAKLDGSKAFAHGDIKRQVSRLDAEIALGEQRLAALKATRTMRVKNEGGLKRSGPVVVTTDGVAITPGSNAHRGVALAQQVAFAQPETVLDPALIGPTE